MITMARIPKEDWMDALPVHPGNTPVHINHDNCPAGRDTKRRLYIKNDGTKYLVYCHNCQGWDVVTYDASADGKYKVGHNTPDLSSLLDQSDGYDASPRLPDDVTFVTTNWPKECLSWLAQNNIIESDIQRYGICYSPSYDRVILPVYNKDNELIYWQARDCNGKDPKYLNIKGCPKPLFVIEPTRTISRVVIVEDILSAIVFAKSANGHDSRVVALLGTKVESSTISHYIEDVQHVYIWLDEDRAGRMGAHHLKKTLQLTHGIKNIKVIPNNYRQPKKLTDQEISHALTDVLR